MTISVNDRAAELADRLAADADALRVAVKTLPGGTRVIDCGTTVPGGLEAMFLELSTLPADSITDPQVRASISTKYDSIPV